MLTKRVSIPIEQAVASIMNYQFSGSVEEVEINESYGRYLSEDIIATHDVPHFNRAPVDGFALRSIDTKQASRGNPLELKVIDHIGAGSVSQKNIEPFEAVRIMTGAQLPEGCDCVIMIELVSEFQRDGTNFISIKRSLKEGENVSFRGEDAMEGEVLIEKGTYINPGVQAMLATFGYAKVPVAKKPRVGVVTTGNELLKVSDPLQPGKIRNSNFYMISAQIERAGGEVLNLGCLPDDLEMGTIEIGKAIEEVDILITTGGVSVGDFDFLPFIYEKMGAKVLFNKVSMRPGSITTVAVLKDKLLFGLSGNPSACYVGFELFVRPIIKTALFSKKPHLKKELAVLDEAFPKANPFTRFVRSSLFVSEGKLMVKPNGKDKSNIIMSLAGANSLMILPGGTRGYEKGAVVEVLLLDDLEGSVWPWKSLQSSTNFKCS